MLKTVSSITNAIGALNYKGTWNATTNSPTLASGVGTKGDYYVVGTAGTTTLDGISNWGVGDWVAFNGTAWQRVEGGADLNGVNLSVSGTSTLSALTASTALALNASKEVVSVANTGTGNNMLSAGGTFGPFGYTSAQQVLWTSQQASDLGNIAPALVYTSDNAGFPRTYWETWFVHYLKVNGSVRMTVASDGKVSFSDVYNTTVGATNRDLYIDDTGLIGYVSSTRESKKNISDLQDVSWLLNLAPVQFNRRKKVLKQHPSGEWLQTDKYSEEIYQETEYGLIADDAVEVNQELCFYDEVDGVKKLSGVHYSKLIAPILKLVQQQQARIDALEAEIKTLKGN